MDNVSTYSARFYEGRTIIGHIAGKMTKTNTIGYIVSFPIPEVIRGINAFYLGATSVNPKFDIDVVWVNTWYDPVKEGDAAKVLISEGADIITQHTDSPAALQIAEKAINKKTGARGLRSILESILLKTMFDLPSMENVNEVIVDSGAAKGQSQPIIVHSKNTQKDKDKDKSKTSAA